MKIQFLVTLKNFKVGKWTKNFGVPQDEKYNSTRMINLFSASLKNFPTSQIGRMKTSDFRPTLKAHEIKVMIPCMKWPIYYLGLILLTQSVVLFDFTENVRITLLFRTVYKVACKSALLVSLAVQKLTSVERVRVPKTLRCITTHSF